MEKLVIATRGSRLALWQANHVKDSLEAAHPGLAVELNIIKTKGDIILDVPLAKVGGKGLFVKEIEEALLSGAADIAVHSMKDVPMELPEGLILGIVPEREDPTDLFLSVDYDSLESLPAGAVVGTSSLRRQAQVAVMLRRQLRRTVVGLWRSLLRLGLRGLCVLRGVVLRALLGRGFPFLGLLVLGLLLGDGVVLRPILLVAHSYLPL